MKLYVFNIKKVAKYFDQFWVCAVTMAITSTILQAKTALLEGNLRDMSMQTTDTVFPLRAYDLPNCRIPTVYATGWECPPVENLVS